MIEKSHQGLKFYQFELFQSLNHGVFTRLGGVSAEPWGALNVGGTVGDEREAVRENHRLIYDALSMNQHNACTVWQVHGGDVVLATQPVKGRKWLAQADAIVTDRADVPLFMRYADCIPILFFDPIQQVIGIAHAGWRGTMQGVGVNTVRVMHDSYGSRFEDIQVGIGPGISRQCFQVGQEVIDAALAYFKDIDDLVDWDPEDGSPYFDLLKANERALREIGVCQIQQSQLCTYQNTDEFYSHRAEKGRTGRFGVVVSL